MRRSLVRVGTVLFAVLLAMQFIPLSRTNPPATREVRWDAPATRALARRTCFDCHTNKTEWPWYSHVAPASFLVISHVNNGRRRLNFSEWDKPQRATFSDVEDNVTRGEMPIWNYVIVHQQAKLITLLGHESNLLIRPTENGFVVAHLNERFSTNRKVKYVAEVYGPGSGSSSPVRPSQ